jgi:hypothetical protein
MGKIRVSLANGEIAVEGPDQFMSKYERPFGPLSIAWRSSYF